MSPPLVVAFALAGRVNIDLTNEPLGKGKDGEDVYLRDIWPTHRRGRRGLADRDRPRDLPPALRATSPRQNPLWNEIPSVAGEVYQWDPQSTYIQEPPYFEKFSMQPGVFCDISSARPLAIFGDSVTTDHIIARRGHQAEVARRALPAAARRVGRGLQLLRLAARQPPGDGARHVRQRPHQEPDGAGRRRAASPCIEPVGEQMSIYDASVNYQAAGIPLVVIAGQEYGTGSSRDWAAKGTQLLGVRAVIAESFERIHRSNLVGMGVLPCQFKEGTNAQTLGLDGTEIFDLVGLESGDIRPRQDVTLRITRESGETEEVPVTLRIDTPIEIEYYRHGGILPFVLRQLIGQSAVKGAEG